MTDKIFHSILDNRIKQHKSRLLFQKRDGWSWKQITWLDFDSEVRGISSFLLDLGFKPGDQVVIISPNDLHCTFVESAVFLIGGECIPVSENESLQNIRYILDDNENIKFVFILDSNILNNLNGILKDKDSIERIFVFEDVKFGEDTGIISYRNLVKFGFLKRKKLNDTINDITGNLSPGDNAIKTYSFREKPASKIITHELLIKLLEMVNKKLRFLSSEDQFFSLLNNTDSFSRMINFLPLYIGNRGAMAGNDREFYQDVKEIMPTILFLNSDTLRKICNDNNGSGTGDSSLKKLLGGRVKYILTDYMPGLAVKSRYIDSGISIIELNELATADA